MHLRTMLLSAFVLILVWVAEIQAQSVEIQNQVERALWYERFLQWFEATTGFPVAVAFSLALVLLLSIGALIWLWLSQRKPD